MTRKQILTAAIATALAATGAIAQDKKQQSQSQQQGNQGIAAAVVLMPIDLAQGQNLGNGCWARLYDSDNFQGDQLSLVGPVDMPTMRTAFGKDWGGEFDSAIVGPNATVTVYDNENYRDKAATFKPNQRIADLGDEKLGWFQDIRSLKIACAGGATAAGGTAEGSSKKK